MGRAPSLLSMVKTTSARPSGARPEVPAKMTSSIFPPRSDFAPCSPITQLRASTTLDLPEPLGPTTQVIPGSKLRVVAEAKDLNPRNVRLLRCTTDLSSGWIPLVRAGATVAGEGAAHPNRGRRRSSAPRARRMSACPGIGAAGDRLDSSTGPDHVHGPRIRNAFAEH